MKPSKIFQVTEDLYDNLNAYYVDIMKKQEDEPDLAGYSVPYQGYLQAVLTEEVASNMPVGSRPL